MVVVEALWLVVSLPWRVIYWFAWQCERLGIRLAQGSQRRFGVRNSALLFALAIGLFGAGLASGVIECGRGTRGCIQGLEVPQGVVFIGIAVLIGFVAVTKVAREDRTPRAPPTMIWGPYRSDDWRMSWRAAVRVSFHYAVIAALLAILVTVASR